ncbi:MAG TPA: polysaccharide deacetylase family protein [Negativicutes bacterium]|nr:polysaccharide deacetylase family protein [Negativicutes bacterium]
MKMLVKGAAIGAALVILAVAWAAWPADGVPILAYHKVSDAKEAYSVSPPDFERQMRYLAESGYTAVSLCELVSHMTAGKPLPDKSIVITFDDGYANNYYYALPIMAQYGMKATVFVISDFIDERPYMKWDEVKAMRKAGTEIGSHTLAHRDLTGLSPAEQARDVAVSKKGLEWRLETPVGFLAYPFGRFDANTVAALKRGGYRGAVSTVLGLNKPGDDVYALKRIAISRSHFPGLLEFRLRLLRANVYSKLGI